MASYYLSSAFWWFKTDAGLATRIAIGVGVFAVLGIVDLVRNGRSAQRWREHVFLVCAAVAGMAYGIANDAVTSSISWEYYFYGKGLDQVMPAQTPPDAGALRLRAMSIGCKAGGSAGVLIGALLLIANNPRAGLRRLTYRQLSFQIAVIYIITICFSLALGIAGGLGWLLWTSNDLVALWQSGDYRPRHFVGVYGIHLGAYVGGALGTLIVLLHVARSRKNEAPIAIVKTQSPAASTPLLPLW
jgi:hypothetical protein